MNILIIKATSVIPAFKYGGTERVIWGLGKALTSMGHKVTFMVKEGSVCDFANIIHYDPSKKIEDQIPELIDVVHFHDSLANENMRVSYLSTLHGTLNKGLQLDKNTVFISNSHAQRHGGEVFVHNGLDWDEYQSPILNHTRKGFHFLGKAAWRRKNVSGAIDIIKHCQNETLTVLGGHRLNIKMGFRLTLSAKISFKGMVGGEEKYNALNASKGLVFPVLWHEPFGLAIIESLYYGCPVFGTKYGSLPELVTDSVGFLSNDSTQLREAILQADAYDRSLCHSLAVDNFNHLVMATEYLKLYEKVLSGKSIHTIAPVVKYGALEQVEQWQKI
ncbi:glycosyl transferase [Psychromonas sp. psych-6C06]|uniref:glycosyltransferase n=1 Tax=Psychromonas sp. psych-6C06 TaxID=2058089 RepID=UPI000C3219B4|nr:glycosyltransferase [Psychromonas sp. psych-6C06]PKF61271.1 glycosyl transferase [Psychromonas sp. psych-6C06]